MATKEVFLHNKKDNVAVALDDLEPGDKVVISRDGEKEEIEVKGEVPFAHKISLKEFEEGEKACKYGEVIGVITQRVGKGVHVHDHNLKSLTYN